MRAFLNVFVSIRTTAILLVALSVLLLAALIVPQRAVLGDETVGSIAASHRAYAFVIDTLGLGAIATSPVFLVVLALFYLNLVSVLVRWMPRTLGRTRVVVPKPDAVAKWTASARALDGTAREPLDGSVGALLRGHGFKPYRVSPNALYGVKHRFSAIGFLIFHVSFFFLFAGGVMIWYTRYVGETRAVEGQAVESKNARLLRMPKLGAVPPVTFTFEKIEPSFERGEATDLRATVRFGGKAPQQSWVNHPANDGPASVLVNDIGIAPVLWLQDRRGFGLDRVAVPADRTRVVDVPLAGGIVQVQLLPKAHRPDFPLRDALRTLPIDMVIAQHGREVFRGALRPGEAAQLPDGRVVLQEVRYWAGLKIISERGGAPLILGFVLACAGAIWRLLLHRRDVVLTWDGPAFRLAGHGEWFADRDRRELMDICTTIEGFTRTAAKPRDVSGQHLDSKEASA